LETIVNSFTEKNVLEKQLLIVLQKRCWSLYILGWRQIQNVCTTFIMFFIKILMDIYTKTYLICILYFVYKQIIIFSTFGLRNTVLKSK
jgi:hypothetical protein